MFIGLKEVLPDESRRLTPQQQAAIEHLLLGATITEAACVAMWRTLVFIAIGRIAAALTGWLRPLGLSVSDSIIAAEAYCRRCAGGSGAPPARWR